MKLRLAKQRHRAFTVLEALVIFFVLIILAAVYLPLLTRPHGCQRINCVSNLRQINLAFRIWEGDNNNQYPMGISVTNGGAMEWIASGNVPACFRVASNELSTTKILICPLDPGRTFATNFEVLDRSNISYFIGVNVTNEDNPQLVLDGDDNFAINGAPVQSGILNVATNTALAWGAGRHGDADVPRHFWKSPPRGFWGNLGFADGSVQEVNTFGLQQAFQKTGLATNRLAIP